MSDAQFYIPVEQLSELRHKIIKEKNRMDKTVDRSDLPERLFTNYISPIVEIYQPIISSLASHNSDLIYRARKCIDNKPFNNISDLCNPPTPSGRACATDHIPILYASSSRQTCLSEIGVKIGDLVNIAAFRYSNITNGKFWFVGQLGTFYKSQEQSRYLSDEKTVQKPFYADQQEAINSLVFKDLLINEIFSTLSSDADKYVLNRFLIKTIRNKQAKKEEFYGVVFVSAKDTPGINFAIYGDAISKLEPSIINLVRITYIDDYRCIGYKWLKNSSPTNGVLEWPE